MSIKTLLRCMVNMSLIFMLTANANAAQTRPFYMGFTPWPYAATIESITSTNEFICKYGDIVSIQIDESIPWDHSLKGTAYPPGFVKKMQDKRNGIRPGIKKVLYITPLNLGRSGLLPSYKNSDYQGVKNWEIKHFNDPEVAKAYIYYCDWMIKFFKPDFLVLSIESNEYLKNVPAEWEHYVEFSRRVHKEIKRRNPKLSVSESFTLHQLFDNNIPDAGVYRTKIKDFIREQDFMAISYYPFFMGMKTAREISPVLDSITKISSKPIAFIETGQPAQTMDIPAYNLHFELSSADQQAYMRTLLEHASRDRYMFVVWWAHRDFDELWKTFPAEVKDLGRCWRDIGLLDENGKPRPSFEEWKKVFDRKYKR